MLREPVAGLRRADVVVLSRADLIEPDQREAIWRVVRRHAAEATLVEAVHAPCSLFSANGEESPIASIQDKPVAAFCGLGNPAGFRRTLEQCGCRATGFREFPDHHRYDDGELNDLSNWATSLDASAVLCTRQGPGEIDRDRLGIVLCGPCASSCNSYPAATHSSSRWRRQPPRPNTYSTSTLSGRSRSTTNQNIPSFLLWRPSRLRFRK